MKVIDTHAHLNFDRYDKDRDTVINTAFANDVVNIINIGIDAKTSLESIELAKKYAKIYATAGWHPHDATTFDGKELKKLLSYEKVVAVGEIGLDYFRNLSPKNIQKKVFREQVEIAMEHDLPIVVHDRNAHKDVMEILTELAPKKIVFHCYSGDYTMSQKIIEMGWHISFTGVVTFDRAKYYSIIKDLPDDKFFVETDAPFLTPKPHRGKRNRSEYVKHIIREIGEIRMKTPNEIAEITTRNAKKFFGI